MYGVNIKMKILKKKTVLDNKINYQTGYKDVKNMGWTPIF